MAGGWGPKKNGVRIGAFWDDLEVSGDGSEAWITNPVIKIDRGGNISDSTNRLEWSGGAVSDGSGNNYNVRGSGVTTVKSVGSQRRTLEYGSTHTSTFHAEFSGLKGGTLYVTRKITYPARKYGLPADPTGLLATRVSDTRQTLTWQRTTTTTAPWQGAYLERRDNLSTDWVVIAGITGKNALATSYTDATTEADREYEYRLRGWNTSGYSGYSNTAAINTPPLPASGLVASRTPAAIKLTWSNPSTISDGSRVSRSDDGGAFAVIATVTGAGATTWTDRAPDQGGTRAYQVELRDGTLFSAPSASSNTVQPLTTPNPPTLLTTGAAVLDATSVIPFSWTHNPQDASGQTKYQIRYRTSTDGGATWLAWTELSETTSDVSSWDAPAPPFSIDDPSWDAPDFTVSRRLEWQVRTWGLYVDPSNYSASQPLTLSAAPDLALTAPGATLPLGRVTPAWTFTDPEGKDQAAAQIRLTNLDASEVLGTFSITGTDGSYEVPVDLDNLTNYRVEARGQDGDGLWGPWAAQDFQTDFQPPPQPSLGLSWDQDRGSILVLVTNPEPAGAEPDATSNKIERSSDGGISWSLVGTTGNGGMLSDPIPPTGVTNTYRALAISDLPSQQYSPDTEIEPDPEVIRWAWFNSGPGFSVVARARGNPKLKESYERTRTTHVFDGRTFGTEYNGSTREHAFSYSGVIETDYPASTEEAFRSVVDAVGPAAYRDPWYRWPVSLSGLDLGRDETPIIREISLDFKRVDSYGDS